MPNDYELDLEYMARRYLHTLQQMNRYLIIAAAGSTVAMVASLVSLWLSFVR